MDGVCSIDADNVMVLVKFVGDWQCDGAISTCMWCRNVLVLAVCGGDNVVVVVIM